MDKKSLGTSALAALFALLLLCSCVLWAGARTRMPAISVAVEGGSAEPSDEPSEEPSDEPTTEPECKTTGAHTPGAWTDNGNGTHSAVCTVCGEPLSEPCNYGEPAAYTPAGNGTHEKTCTVCGGKVTEKCVYGEPAVYTPAGNGTHEKACTVCGDKVTEACVYGEPVSAPPTQTDPGTRTRTCTVCGYKEITETSAPEGTREKSALMGDMDKNGKVETDDARAVLRASISLAPVKTKTAAYADLNEDGKITPADARLALRIAVGLDTNRRHQIKYEITATPTCTEPGEVKWTCAYCGFGETLTVPANGHSWKGPTAKSARSCSVCGLMLTGWQTYNGKPIYYNADGTVTAGRSLLYTTYQGKKAYWYLNNGVPDLTYRGTITCNGADWIITGGSAYQVKTASDRTLFRAFGEVAKATTPDMTMAEKLRACFVYCKTHYTERRPRTPHYLGIDWPIIYANDMFAGSGGNCCSYAAAFAFMAKAIGYENVYACNSGGHGWAEINGNVFDPEWSKKDGLYAVTYYNLSYDARTDVRYKEAISAREPWMHVKI